MAESQDPKEPQADAGDEADDSRRQFIKRLAYIPGHGDLLAERGCVWRRRRR